MFDESLGCFEFLDLYRDPGPTHDSLAAAAADGMRLLTVNFDDLFERAIDRIGLIPRTVDADRQDGVEWSNGTHVPVVRLHGTRRSHIDGTVHPSLDSVQATTVGIAATSPGTQLSDRAIGTFQEAVNHRTLVVLGYSASDDLDVVPTLQQADPAKLIWLEYEESSPRKVSAPQEPGASAVVGIVKDRGIEVQVIRGRTSESLRLLGFPAGFKPPRIRVNWTHSIRNWANRHRWKDPTAWDSLAWYSATSASRTLPLGHFGKANRVRARVERGHVVAGPTRLARRTTSATGLIFAPHVVGQRGRSTRPSPTETTQLPSSRCCCSGERPSLSKTTPRHASSFDSY